MSKQPKNAANIYTGDLVKILGQSPFMSKAMGDCPDDEWQRVEDSFNRLMWQMVDVTLHEVSEAVRRRSLREVQVGNRTYVPKPGPLIEIKENTQPHIYEQKGVYKADVETPDGKVTVEFEEKTNV